MIGMESAQFAVLSAYSALNQRMTAKDKTFDHSMGYITQKDGNERRQLSMLNKIKINTDASYLRNLIVTAMPS